MKRVDLQIAYVLHRRAYKNSSAIVEFFTRDYGRLSILAKGVRRNKSRFSALLQVFQPLLISWGGKGDLPILYSAESHSNGFQFVGPTLYSAFYLNELIIKFLTVHDPHTDLFETYHSTLLGFAEAENIQVCLRRFERELLNEVGYGLNLHTDCYDEPITADKTYCYIVEQGAVPVKQEVQANNNNLKLKGSSLLAIREGSFSSEQDLLEAKLLMRSIIDYYLGHKPLNSRKLFNTQPV